MATLVAARDALRLAATMSSEGDAYMPLADALALVSPALILTAVSATNKNST
jgi:hypothetical protein